MVKTEAIPKCRASICCTSNFHEDALHLRPSLPSCPAFLFFFYLSLTRRRSFDITHPTRNNTVSSGRWQWCMSPMGETLFRCCHHKAIFALPPPPPHRPHVKEIQRHCPKCDTLISLKLFIGICGASAAGLSPFQLPDLFNSAGNEKCAALLELRSRKPSRLSRRSLPLFQFSPSNHRSRTCSTVRVGGFFCLKSSRAFVCRKNKIPTLDR